MALLVLLILFGATLVAVPILFKDKLVTMVTNEANENLNAVLTVSDFKVSIFKDFPNITVSLHGYDISGVGEFENVSLVNGDYLGISVDVYRLLGGEGIAIENVMLENPQVYVYVTKNGKANYDIAKESTEEAAEEEAPEASSDDIQIALQGWSLNNAHIVYDDHDMDVFMELNGLNQQGSGDFTLSQFILSTQTQAKALTVDFEGIRYLAEATVDLKADLDMDIDKMAFGFRQNELLVNDLPINFNGTIEMPGDDIKMDLAAGSSESSLKKLLSLIPAVFTEGYESLTADGSFTLDAKVNGVYNDNTYPGFDIKLGIKNGKVQYPDLPASIDQIALKSSVTSAGGNDLDNVIIDVSNFHVDIANNPLDLSLFVKTPMSDPNIDAKLYTKMDLASLAKAVPMEGYNYSGKLNANLVMKGKMSSLEMEQYEDFNASGNLSAMNINLAGDSVPMPLRLDTARLEFSPKFIALRTLKANVSETPLAVSGELSNYMGYIFKDQDLRGVVDISSDYVNLNAFMTEEEGPVTTEEETEEVAEEYGYIEVPGNIDFTLNAAIGELLYEDLVINDFKGQLAVKNKTVSFNNVGLKTLGGSAVMNGSYATLTDKPEVALSFDVKTMSISQTAQAFNTVEKLAPIAKACKGDYSAKFSINGNLTQNLDPVWESFAGMGAMETKAVVVEDFQPLNKLANTLKMESLAKQSLKDLFVNFEIKEGKLFIKPIETNFGDIPARITGSTSIDQQIDYTFNLKVPRKKLGAGANQAIAGLSEKLGADALGEVIDLDVFMTNTVTDPKIRTNLAGVAKGVKDQVVDKAKEELEKKKKELQDKAQAEKERLEAEAKAKAEEAKRKLEEEKEKARAKAEAEKKRLEEEARRKAEEEKKRLEEEAKKKAKDLFKRP